MTEDEYIAVSDLTRARAALEIIQYCTSEGFQDIRRELVKWIREHENGFECEPEKGAPFVMTDAQRKKMRHALGLDSQKMAYRNHYYVALTDDDWDALVRAGMAEVSERDFPRDGFRYSATMAGFLAVSEPGETHDGECGL